MEEKEKQAAVSYFVYEGSQARMERIVNKLTVTIVLVLAVALVMFIANNVIWMHYIRTQQPPTTVEEVVDAGVYQQSDPGADR